MRGQRIKINCLHFVGQISENKPLHSERELSRNVMHAGGQISKN